MNSPSLRYATLCILSVGGETVLFGLKLGRPVGQGAVPSALLDDEHDLRDGLARLRQAWAGGFR